MRLRVEVREALARESLRDPEVTRRLLDHWATKRFPERREYFQSVKAALRDLDLWLTEVGASGGRATGVPVWIANHVVQLLTLAGVLATTAYSFAYLPFYDDLGLSPAEVGLDSGQRLVQSVFAAVIFALAMGSMAFIAVLPTVLVISPSRDSRLMSQKLTPRSQRSWLISALVVAAVMIASAAYGLYGASMSEYFHAAVAGSSLLPQAPELIVLVVVVPLGLAVYHAANGQGSLIAVNMTMVAAAFVISVFVCAGFILPRTLRNIAHARAQHVQEMHTVEPPKVAGVPLLNLRAVPARLIFGSLAGVPPEARDCVMYLGKSDGQLVVYTGQRRPLRIPANRAIVQTTGKDAC